MDIFQYMLLMHVCRAPDKTLKVVKNWIKFSKKVDLNSVRTVTHWKNKIRIKNLWSCVKLNINAYNVNILSMSSHSSRPSLQLWNQQHFNVIMNNRPSLQQSKSRTFSIIWSFYRKKSVVTRQLSWALLRL